MNIVLHCDKLVATIKFWIRAVCVGAKLWFKQPKNRYVLLRKHGSYAAAVQPCPHDYQQLLLTKLFYWTRGSSLVLNINI